MIITGKFTSYYLISANIFHIEKLFRDIIPAFTFSMGTTIITVVMENKKKFIPDPNLKPLDQVPGTLRCYHYARSMEKVYCQWIMHYICFFLRKRCIQGIWGKKKLSVFFPTLPSMKRQPPLPRGRLSTPWYLSTVMLFKPLDNTIVPVRSKRKRPHHLSSENDRG